ncbi:unnamed protein product [Ostreobium quekettii]|uniref:J domain-containing protein n=1 Tax=Ostreobium quekettii TaxID=121088 RepID=A0A8S1J5S9_9CHLO|nr:unnamed protein product [Ostreobium quekettii]|eukprot:evm.model.scf_922.3 EVM.evm.TU.scf_922.3   scf_922:28088-37949(-)
MASAREASRHELSPQRKARGLFVGTREARPRASPSLLSCKDAMAGLPSRTSEPRSPSGPWGPGCGSTPSTSGRLGEAGWGMPFGGVLETRRGAAARRQSAMFTWDDGPGRLEDRMAAVVLGERGCRGTCRGSAYGPRLASRASVDERMTTGRGEAAPEAAAMRRGDRGGRSPLAEGFSQWPPPVCSLAGHQSPKSQQQRAMDGPRLREDKDSSCVVTRSVTQLERSSSMPDAAALQRRCQCYQAEVEYLKEREGELRGDLSRARVENAALSAKVQRTHDMYKEALEARRTAREALSEMAQENARLVAAFIEKKQDLRSMQDTAGEERRMWAEQLEALEAELKHTQEQLSRVQGCKPVTPTMSDTTSDTLSEFMSVGELSSEEDVPGCLPCHRSPSDTAWASETAKSLRTLQDMQVENERLQEENVRLRHDYDETAKQQECHDLHQAAEEMKKRGNQMFKCERYQEAMDEYSQGLQLGLEDHSLVAVLHCNRAAALLNLNRFLEALADCFVAVAMDGSYSRAFQRRADVFAALGDFSSAVEDLKTVLARGGGQQVEARTQLTDVLRKANSGQAIDAYRVLGVSPSAPALEIKTSYRQLALKYHPDKAAHVPGSDVLFKLVAEANAMLSDPHKRQQYDLDMRSRTRAPFRSTRF